MGNEEKKHSESNLVLIGIIAGVLLGFLVGWFVGPSLIDQDRLYHSTLKKVLTFFDQNGDGLLDQKEGAFLKKFFSKFDDNDNKKLSLNREFSEDSFRKLSLSERNLLSKITFRALKKQEKNPELSLGRQKEAKEKGVLLQEAKREARGMYFWFELFGLFGEIFLNALKMLIVPLIITSMIGGVTALGDIRKLGRVGGYTIVYYVITTALAVVVGLVLVNIIQPGVGVEAVAKKAVETKELSLFEVIRGFVHPNIFGAMVDMDILPLIIFSLVLGGILTTMGERSKVTLDVINCLGEAIMKFVMLLMYLAPLGIFGLLAFKVGMAGGNQGFGTELKKLGWYAFTVIFGLFLHGMVVLPLIYYLLTRKNPLKYMVGMLNALVTAFSTSSSSATLPLTMECAETNNNVSKQAASFVCPLGATINMDGTALYEAVAAMFIAQVYGMSIGISGQVLIFITATLAAIGAAGIPQAGLVTMIVVLEAVGIPVDGIALILVIDWFLDRCRTTVNVLGDSLGAGVIDDLVIQKSGEN